MDSRTTSFLPKIYLNPLESTLSNFCLLAISGCAKREKKLFLSAGWKIADFTDLTDLAAPLWRHQHPDEKRLLSYFRRLYLKLTM
jgi:hypothetical protein